MNLADTLADQLDGTREWTLKLVADLEGDDWSFQPAEGLAHAVWLCGHLACSEDLLVHGRCLGEKNLDESFTRHFPIGGSIQSLAEHDYPKPDEILDTMRQVHEATCRTVRQMDDAFLAKPAFAGDGRSIHPHYRDIRGAIAHCSRHEAFHAGQLALIRRLLGKPFLR